MQIIFFTSFNSSSVLYLWRVIVNMIYSCKKFSINSMKHFTNILYFQFILFKFKFGFTSVRIISPCYQIKESLYSWFIRQRHDLKGFNWIYKSLKIPRIIKVLYEVIQILIHRLKTFQKWLEIKKGSHFIRWSSQLNFQLWFKNNSMYPFIFVLWWGWG